MSTTLVSLKVWYTDMHPSHLGSWFKKQNSNSIPDVQQEPLRGEAQASASSTSSLVSQLHEASLPLLYLAEARNWCFCLLVSSKARHGQHFLEPSGAWQKQLDMPSCASL